MIRLFSFNKMPAKLYFFFLYITLTVRFLCSECILESKKSVDIEFDTLTILYAIYPSVILILSE